MKCPRCGSHDVRKVSAFSSHWHAGYERCLDCSFEGDWLLFMGFYSCLECSMRELQRPRAFESLRDFIDRTICHRPYLFADPPALPFFEPSYVVTPVNPIGIGY